MVAGLHFGRRTWKPLKRHLEEVSAMHGGAPLFQVPSWSSEKGVCWGPQVRNHKNIVGIL